MLSRMGKLSNEISEKGITGFDQQFEVRTCAFFLYGKAICVMTKNFILDQLTV